MTPADPFDFDRTVTPPAWAAAFFWLKVVAQIVIGFGLAAYLFQTGRPLAAAAMAAWGFLFVGVLAFLRRQQ